MLLVMLCRGIMINCIEVFVLDGVLFFKGFWGCLFGLGMGCGRFGGLFILGLGACFGLVFGSGLWRFVLGILGYSSVFLCYYYIIIIIVDPPDTSYMQIYATYIPTFHKKTTHPLTTGPNTKIPIHI